MMRLSFVLVLAACAAVYGANSESAARLLVSKAVLNQMVVEGRDLTVHYEIYNVGSSAAQEVTLIDTSFPPEVFTVKHGLLSTKWKSIPPSSNVTHAVILEPQQSGYFNFTAAKVTYIPTDDAEPQTVYSTAPGEGGIMTAKDFGRKHAPHLVDWGFFGLMVLPTVGIPFLVWYKSHTKYENYKGKKL